MLGFDREVRDGGGRFRVLGCDFRPRPLGPTAARCCAQSEAFCKLSELDAHLASRHPL